MIGHLLASEDWKRWVVDVRGDRGEERASQMSPVGKRDLIEVSRRPFWVAGGECGVCVRLRIYFLMGAKCGSTRTSLANDVKCGARLHFFSFKCEGHHKSSPYHVSRPQSSYPLELSICICFLC